MASTAGRREQREIGSGSEVLHEAHVAGAAGALEARSAVGVEGEHGGDIEGATLPGDAGHSRAAWESASGSEVGRIIVGGCLFGHCICGRFSF